MPDLPWEDALLERKVESDTKDLLKTFVAFANSVRPNHIAVVLIGEDDDGTPQGVTNPDAMQKRVRGECEKIYPPIPWRSKVYERAGKYCLRVEIEYDGDTPHFGGPAWVRRGSETIKASGEAFQRLIDLRSSTVRELMKYVGKDVFVEGDLSGLEFRERALAGHPKWPGTRRTTLILVNAFWATFKMDNGKEVSEPIGKLTLSWHDDAKTLKVLIKA